MPSKVASIRDMLIPIIIEEVKKYSDTFEVTPLKALEESISHTWFYYSQGQLGKTGRTFDLSKREYFDMICNFILSDRNTIPAKYLNLIRKYYNYNFRTFPLDKEFLDNLCDSIRSEQKRIKKLKSDMSETLRILDHQDAFSSLDYVFPLVEALRLKKYSDFIIFLYVFNYGVIMGKRAERAKCNGRKI